MPVCQVIVVTTGSSYKMVSSGLTRRRKEHEQFISLFTIGLSFFGGVCVVRLRNSRPSIWLEFIMLCV